MSLNNQGIHKWLLPAASLYGAATAVRNFCYDRGLKKSFRADIPVISVGNITAGGTGKTPHTEYLIRLLQNRCRLAVLSRGYGRKTKGYLSADAGSSPETLGDEPYQMHSKYPSITVAVAEKRCIGLKALADSISPDAVILDDAFQHRAVTPSLNILLVSYRRNIMEDALIPAGLLRESTSGRKRADIVIVTKCPDDMSREDMEIFRTSLDLNDSQKLFFTRIKYGNLTSLDGSAGAIPTDSLAPDMEITIVTGIASPQPILETLGRHTRRISPIIFPDHHVFSISDLEKVRKDAGGSSIIVITEKDAVKISSLDIDRELRKRIFVLPIEVEFLQNGDIFDRTIINHIDNFHI